MKKLLAGCLMLTLLGCPPSSPDPSQLPIFTPPSTSTETSSAAVVESGIAIAIVLDTSGSMSGARLDSVKQIWLQTLAPRLTNYQNRFGNLEVSLITCAGDAVVLLPNQLADMARLNASVSGLNAGGGTPLGESLLAGLQQVAASRQPDKHVFILTDGENTGMSPRLVLEGMQTRGISDVGLHLIGFEAHRSYYKDFEDFNVQVVMAENPAILDETCSLMFREILKVEQE